MSCIYSIWIVTSRLSHLGLGFYGHVSINNGHCFHSIPNIFCIDPHHLQRFCDSIVIIFLSIDIKTSTTKTIMELIWELKLITSINPTWAMCCWIFDFHNNNNIVNPKTKVPPILREFFKPLQRFTKLELYQATQHILLKTLKRTLPYSKNFLKLPKHMKPSPYHI